MRPTWHEYFMQMATLAATRSTCSRRQVGAVIVLEQRVIATGYNGAPAGVTSCLDREECLRTKLGIPSGERHELCWASHAEANAIAQAARNGAMVKGATLVCTHGPCSLCAKLIINSGIQVVIYKDSYPDKLAADLFDQAGVTVWGFDELKTLRSPILPS